MVDSTLEYTFIFSARGLPVRGILGLEFEIINRLELISPTRDGSSKEFIEFYSRESCVLLSSFFLGIF